MADDLLKDLPRLGQGALGPCIKCQRAMLATGLPLFLRFAVKRCGIDATEVRRHVGLAAAMSPANPTAGLGIASIMGAHRDPVVVLDEYAAVNVCMACADELTANDLHLLTMERFDG